MRARSVFVLFAACGVLAIDASLSSCGNGTSPVDDGGGTEAGQDSGCQPSNDAAEWTLPPTPDWEAGVPLSQISLAMATAQCRYLAKCTPLAAYVLGECIDALTNAAGWTYGRCATMSGQFLCSGLDYRTQPAPHVLQELEAGALSYDPVQAAACVAALQAQSCTNMGLLFDIAPCLGVFSCTDGGVAPDGGPCVSPYPPPGVKACTTSSDCADSGASPYCVSGYCYSMPCEQIAVDAGCATSAGKGQPCDSDPHLLGSEILPTPWGTWSAMPCAPGLTCRGLTADGGLGTCDDAREVGAPCEQGAAISGCATGLLCQCGVCAIPPSQGPCAGDHQCQVGVAYCEIDGGTCQPVLAQGGDCSGAFIVCAPQLQCGNGLTCQPFPP